MSLLSYPSETTRLVALVLASNSLLGCKGEPSQGPTPPVASSSTPELTSAPLLSASAPVQPQASAPLPLKDDRPRARCVAAGGQNTIFLGRLLKFSASAMVRDRLGLVIVGESKGRPQVRRLAIDPPGELKFEKVPKSEVLLDGAFDCQLTPQSLYCLKQDKETGKDNLVYLPLGEDAPQAKVLANDISVIVGEGEGWLYALRLKDILTERLSPPALEVVRNPSHIRSANSGIESYHDWRYTFDLVRVRLEGTLEVVGVVPRSVDTYFDGYVYGRFWDRAQKELSIFRMKVPGGAKETIYQRKTGRMYDGIPSDRIDRLGVDKDGVFFFDGSSTEVRRINHNGGQPDTLMSGLSFSYLGFSHPVEVVGDYFFVDGNPKLKKRGKIAFRTSTGKPAYRGENEWSWDHFGCWREGTTEIVRRGPTLMLEYLPGGTVQVAQLKTRESFKWLHVTLDEDCIYYSSGEGGNSWYYALPKAAKD